MRLVKFMDPPLNLLTLELILTINILNQTSEKTDKISQFLVFF